MQASNCLSAFPVIVVPLSASSTGVAMETAACRWCCHVTGASLYSAEKEESRWQELSLLPPCLGFTLLGNRLHHSGRHQLHTGLRTTASTLCETTMRNESCCFQLWAMTVSSLGSIFVALSVAPSHLWHLHFLGQAWGTARGPALQHTSPGREGRVPAGPASSLRKAGAWRRGGGPRHELWWQGTG